MMYNIIFSTGPNFPILSTLPWEIKIPFWVTESTFPNVSLLCLHLKTVSQHYFISLVHPMLSKALQLSFHELAFAQWHFILVKKYQVKFCMAETSNLKSILSKIMAKTLCNMICFAETQLCSEGYVILKILLIQHFLMAAKLISWLFKKNTKKMALRFLFGQVYLFLK